MELLEDRAVPATFEVTSLADSGPDTLRQAIIDSFWNDEADTITFNSALAGQTITLTTSAFPGLSRSALVILGDDVTIDGAASPGLTISGGGEFRLFGVSPLGVLTLKNLTLADGLARGGDGGVGKWGGGGGAGLGGAVYVFGGTLNIENSTLTNNLARGGDGGYGDLLDASGAGGGGGTLGDGGSGVGGGDGAGGEADTFGPGASGDSGLGAGGGAGVDGGLGAGGGAGGDGDGGVGGGGGGDVANPGLSLYGGGAAGVGGGGGAGLGGAVFNLGGTINIVNSTLTGNSAVGGSGGGSADESAAGGPAGGDGRGLGAAVFSVDGTLNILNSTIAENAGLTGIESIALSNSTAVVLNNAILWSTPGPGLAYDLRVDDLTAMGSATSGVGNLIGSSWGFDGTVVSSADPQLGGLADNGGPTRTMLPAGTSPALGVGDVDAASGLLTDQRGMLRTIGGTIAIGSVEITAETAPTITSAASTTFTTGTAGTFTFTATGVPTPSFSYVGTLPSGVTFVDNEDGTATLSGTPAAGMGQVYSITVTASNGIDPDASQVFSLTVNQAPAITSADETTFTIGSFMSFTVATTGWPTPSLTYSGVLPSGVTFVDNADGTATISGTPAAGSNPAYGFAIIATNGTATIASQDFILWTNQALAIAPSTLPTPSLGDQYTFMLTGSGGSGEGYSFTAECLPPGLALSTDGILSGTPTDPECWPYTFQVSVTDSTGATGVQSFTLDLNPPIVISPATAPVATVGNAYSLQYSATGGGGDFRFDIEYPGDEPIPGLSFTEDGILVGTPTVAGTYTFHVIALEGSPVAYNSTKIEVMLIVNPALEIAPATLPVATAANAFIVQLSGEGGSGSGYVFSAVGLPGGLVISTAGLISGTPTTSGTYSIVATLTDSNGATGTRAYSLVVNSALSISPATLATATVGSAYSQQFSVDGGSGSGNVFSAAGTLPEGMTLSPSGLLSGALASTSGSPFAFQILVVDSVGGHVLQAFTLDAQGSASSTVLAGPSGPVGYGSAATFSATVATAGGASAVPTGTVTFYDGETPLGIVELIDGVATFTTTSLQPGLLAIRAVYSGDSVYQASTAPVVTQSVLVASTVSLSTSPAPPTYGETLTFTAMVASTVSPFLTGGLVGFYDGETLMGTGVLAADGTATFSTAALGVGSHSIRAIYAGNVYFAPAASTPVTVDVAKNAAITGTVSASPSQVYFGQAVALSATFGVESDGSPMTGTVSFYEGGTFLGSAPLVPGAIAGQGIAAQTSTAVGSATLPGVILSVGGHAILAVYSGDANYATASTAATAQVVVAPVGTSTNLVAGAGADGTTVLTASVTPTTPGDPTIAGTVTFFDGDNALASVAVVNGVASLNVGALGQGAHVFRAVFSGGGDASSSSRDVVVAASGPRVVGLSRYGFHASPTTIVLTFDSALDPATAQNPGNYRIARAGRTIAVVSAAYDPATNTVTLKPAQRLNLHWAYSLTVNGKLPTGLTGATGVPLDGAGANQPGTDFVATITWKNLTAPGAEPAVTFSQGAEQSTTSTFNRYVNAVVARYRAAVAARTRAVHRVAARVFRPRGR